MPSAGIRSRARRRAGIAQRPPGPGVARSVRRAGCPARTRTARARSSTSDEVEERLQEVLVVEVAVPALRRDAVGVRRLRHRVPEVDVLELRPEARGRRSRCRACGATCRRRTTGRRAPSVAPVAVERTTNSLPARTAVLAAAPASVRSVSATNAAALRLDCLPVLSVEELGERRIAVAVAVELGDDPPLRRRRARAPCQRSARRSAVDEDAVVELVGRDDPALLEGPGDVVDPRCESCLRPVHDRAVRYPMLPRRASSSSIGGSALRREACVLRRGIRPSYSLYGSTSFGRQASRSRHDLEPDLEPDARRRPKPRLLDRAVRVGGGYSGDFARVLASLDAANRPTSSSRPSTPTASRSRSSAARTRARAGGVAAIGLPERLAQLRGAAGDDDSSRILRRTARDARYGRGEATSWSAGSRGWPAGRVRPLRRRHETSGPAGAHRPVDDVVSIGTDPRRDWATPRRLARRCIEPSVRIVRHATMPAPAVLPGNVTAATTGIVRFWRAVREHSLRRGRRASGGGLRTRGPT